MDGKRIPGSHAVDIGVPSVSVDRVHSAYIILILSPSCSEALPASAPTTISPTSKFLQGFRSTVWRPSPTLLPLRRFSTVSPLIT